MAATGGKTPYDQANALAGPARTVWAELSVTAPEDLYDIIPGVADEDGEYPVLTGWNDFGLAADAPTYSHGKDTTGLEYQQPTGVLFEQITDITRTFTAQVAEISAEAMAIVENTPQTDIEPIAAAPGQAPQKKVPFGLYSQLIGYRIGMISYRPDGAGSVTEPVTGLIRPCAVALVLPICRLSTDESSLDFERGTPTNAAVTFRAFKDTAQPAGAEHGYWVIEQPATIAAIV